MLVVYPRNQNTRMRGQIDGWILDDFRMNRWMGGEAPPIVTRKPMITKLMPPRCSFMHGTHHAPLVKRQSLLCISIGRQHIHPHTYRDIEKTVMSVTSYCVSVHTDIRNDSNDSNESAGVFVRVRVCSTTATTYCTL